MRAATNEVKLQKIMTQKWIAISLKDKKLGLNKKNRISKIAWLLIIILQEKFQPELL